MNPAPQRAASKQKPRFIYLLNVAQRRVESAIQEGGDGKSAARSGLLFALDASGDAVSMAKLGTALDMGPSTLSGLIDRMARDRLVERRQDPNDGRAWQVALTQSGKMARAEAVRATRRLNDTLADGFDDTELAIVVRWLESVRTKFPTKKL